MCKSLYSTVLVPSTLSDSNPVPRRFCSIVSICLTFFSLSHFLSLLLSPSTTNQPTTRNNEDMPTSLPSQKKTRSKGRKERKKKDLSNWSITYTYLYT